MAMMRTCSPHSPFGPRYVLNSQRMPGSNVAGRSMNVSLLETQFVASDRNGRIIRELVAASADLPLNSTW